MYLKEIELDNIPMIGKTGDTITISFGNYELQMTTDEAARIARQITHLIKP